MQVYPAGAALGRAVILGGLVLLAALQLPAAAQEPNDITLRLDSTTGNPGDMVEVTVDLVADDVLPEAFALFLAYDRDALEPISDAYEIIARDEFTGEPIVDGNGNTVASSSLVRPASGVGDAGKTVAFQVYDDPGAVGILVHGLNTNTIPAGDLLTVAFRIQESVPDGSMTDVIGVDEAAEVHIPDGSGGVSQLISSFTRTIPDENEDPEVVLITYGFENTAVIVGCIPANPPAGLTATQDRSDGVRVSWSPVAGDNIEYRVYRSTTNSATTATPIGEQWQTETSFTDITALVPDVVPGECFMPEQVNEVHYFYWVRARSEVGCESELSTQSAEGFRVQAAAKSAAVFLSGSGEGGRMVVYVVLAAALLLAGRGTQRSRMSNGC